MPRTFTKYQYETSPRKLAPEYTPVKNPYKSKKTTTRKTKGSTKQEKDLKKKQIKAIKYLVIGFVILFAISYRNSKIDENFSKIQDMKKELSDIEKKNIQLQVAIENGLNLNNLEQEAKEQLGMQKLNSRQITYITLPKNDYIEPATEEVIIDEDTNWFESIINTVSNIFK